MTAVTPPGGDVAVTVVAALFRPGSDLASFLARLERTCGPGVQIVVVDDASGDGTAEALSSWAAARDDVDLIVHRRNEGVAASRNEALEIARGEYVWFVDHDDAWDEAIVSTLVTRAVEDDADIVVCRADYRVDPARRGRVVDGLAESRTVDGVEALILLAEGAIEGFLWSKLVRRRVLGPSPFPPLSSQSDTAGMASVFARAEKVSFTPELMYHWINRPGSITRRVPRPENLRAAHDLVQAALASLPTSPRVVAARHLFTARFYCKACFVVPIRLGSSRALRREGVRLARSASAGLDRTTLRRRAPTLWAMLLGVRWAPRMTEGVLRAAWTVLDSARRVRSLGVPATRPSR